MDTAIYYWLSGGLFLLGIILFFVLANRRKYRSTVPEQIDDEQTEDNEHIEHYTKIRDKVTVRKTKVKKVKEEERSGVNFGSVVVSLITVGIIMFVGLQVLSAVQSAVCDNGSMNISVVQFNVYSGNNDPAMQSLGTCVNGQLEGGVFSWMWPIMAIGGVLFVVWSSLGAFIGNDNR